MMFAKLGLRARIFLFFCLIAFGGVAATALALYVGYSRAGSLEVLNAFVLAGLVMVFAILAMVAGVWLLFDENVAKPIDKLASDMRARAHAGVKGEIDTHAARFLGDLAPAAAAVSVQLSDQTMSTAETVAAETARLEAEKQRLTALLTDIPLAMVIVNPSHQIVLYNGQAAEVLAQVAHPRLNAPLFHYLSSGSRGSGAIS